MWANMSDDELLDNFNRIRRKWERMVLRVQLATGVPSENVGRCLVLYAQQLMMNPVPTLGQMVADIPQMRATSQTGIFPI